MKDVKDSEEQKKVDEYLDVIENRILAPIQNTEVRSYCTATLLLLFAAIDGLGKLLHPNDTAGSNERIRGFLEYMGSDYGGHKKELLKLRNSLVHNAINVESFLSHADSGTDQHLKKIGAAGFIYVNTMVMYKDVVSAFERFCAEIKGNVITMKRSADRLEWRVDTPCIGPFGPNVAIPSPPPPVEFIYAK